jgi:hypothetical protein
MRELLALPRGTPVEPIARRCVPSKIAGSPADRPSVCKTALRNPRFCGNYFGHSCETVEMPNELISQFLVSQRFDFGRIAQVVSGRIADFLQIIKQRGGVCINQPLRS